MTATTPPEPRMDRPALLAALRARTERPVCGEVAAAGDSLPLCAAIDQGLPGGGLARAALHEILAEEPETEAAADFCALVLARAGGTVLWIGAEARPPGLARFGLSPAALVLVRAPCAEDAAWAMEEGLRCPGIAGALLVAPELDPEAARRLQLAAEAGGGIGLVLRPEAAAEAAMAALTRWRVTALAGAGGAVQSLGDPRWQLDLLRCRGGRPGSWQVVWRPAAERLELDDAEGAGPEEAPAGPVAPAPQGARRPRR